MRCSLFFLLAISFLGFSPPARAQQQDCSFQFQFTGDSNQAAQNNSSQTRPCVNWRVTWSTSGTLSTTVTFQISPDGTVWTSVPNSICSSTQQPPCVISGANPSTGAQGQIYLSAYGTYIRVTTSRSSGSGTGTVAIFGVKGASASAGSGSGGGSGPSLNAYYVVTQASNSPPNAVNLGSLSGSTELLGATISGGVATPFAGPTYYPVALPIPASPTLATVGTPGAKIYAYSVVALGQLGYSASSPLATISTGPTTLSGTNYITVTTSPVTGATSCDIFRIITPAAGYFNTFVGNVACGSVFSDTNPAIPNGPGTVGESNIVSDASLGESVKNLVVPGFAALGNAALGTNLVNTQGQSVLSVGQTVTGFSGGTGMLDPTEMSMSQTVAPGGNNYVEQVWDLLLYQTVPASNTYNIAGIEGISLNQTVNGSGNLGGNDGINVSSTINGSEVLNGLIYDAMQVNESVNTTANASAIGWISGITLAVTGVATAPDVWGLYVEAFGGGAVNYASIRIDDNSSVGTSSSYGIDVAGPTWIALNAAGEVKAGRYVVQGSKFTATGCSNSTLLGGATAGSFHSGTTGTCTVVVTFGDAGAPKPPNSYACFASDTTTVADIITMTASTQTTATFSGTTVSGDVIKFGCLGF